MPRLPNMTNRDEVPEALLEAYDQVAELRGGAVSGPYGVLLHSPEAAIRGAALSNYLRWNSAPNAVQRETAIITLAKHLDARVMWAGHVRLGREVGVREGLIDAIEAGVDTSELPAEEGEIVRYVREAVRGEPGQRRHVRGAARSPRRPGHRRPDGAPRLLRLRRRAAERFRDRAGRLASSGAPRSIAGREA